MELRRRATVGEPCESLVRPDKDCGRSPRWRKLPGEGQERGDLHDLRRILGPVVRVAVLAGVPPAEEFLTRDSQVIARVAVEQLPAFFLRDLTYLVLRRFRSLLHDNPPSPYSTSIA